MSDDSIKKLKDLETQAKKSEKAISDLNKNIEKGSKSNVRAIDELVDSYKKWGDTLKSSPRYFKSIESLAANIDKVNKNVKEMDSELKDMGVNFSASMDDINKASKETLDTYNQLINKTNTLGKSQSKLSVIPNKLKEIQQGLSGMKTGQVDAFKKSMASLGNVLNVDQFSDISKAMSKLGEDDNLTGNLENLSRILIEDVQQEFKNLKEMGAFNSLDEESKKMFDNLSKGSTDIEDLGSMISSMEKIFPKLEEASKNFTETLISDAAKAEQGLAGTGQELLKFRSAMEKVSLINFNLKNFEAQAKDSINHIRQSAEDLDLFPDTALDRISQVRAIEEDIKKDHADLKDLAMELASLGDKDLARKKALIDKQEMLNSRVRENGAALKEVAHNADLYLEAAESMSVVNWGKDKIDSMQKNIYKTSIGLRTMGSKIPGIGKYVDALGEKMGKIGFDKRKFAIGAALIAGSTTLLKKMMEIETETAKGYQSIAQSGLLVGRSAGDMQDAMKSARSESTNLFNLFKAASSGALGDAFALSRDEIIGTVSDLDKAGLAAKNLKSQMQGVQIGTNGAGKEMVSATEMIRTFSSNIGVADSEVAGMMGNMSHDFNSTMGSMKSNFTDITNAIHGSGMSTTRFMGILGSSTQGVSLYADQISSTAKMIEKLGKVAALSGKDIEGVMQATNAAGQDTQKLAVNLSLLSQEDRADIAATGATRIAQMEKERKELAESLSSATDPDQKKQLNKDLMQKDASIKNAKKYNEGLKKGDVLNAAADFKYADKDSQVETVASIANMYVKKFGEMDSFGIEEISKGDPAMKQMLDLYRKSGNNKDLFKEMMKEQEGASGTFEEMNAASAEQNKLTADAKQKFMDAAKDEIYYRARSLDYLATIAGAIGGVGGGLMSIASFASDSLSVFSSLKSLGALTKLGPVVAKAGSMLGAAGNTMAGVGGAAAGAAGTAALWTGGAVAAGAAGYAAGTGLDWLADKGLGAVGVEGGIGGGLASLFGSAISDEDAMKQAEKNFKKPKRPEMHKPSIPVQTSVPVTSTSVPVTNSSATSSSSGEKTEASSSAPINIIINGNDEERMQKVVIDVIERKYKRKI